MSLVGNGGTIEAVVANGDNITNVYVNGVLMFELFELTTFTTNGGETTINTNSAGYVDWADGSGVVAFSSGDIIGTAPVGATVTIWSLASSFKFVSDTIKTITAFDAINFTSLSEFCVDNALLSSIIITNTGNVSSFTHSWLRCSSLTTFPAIDTSSAFNIGYAWEDCTSLVTFPAINTSNVESFDYAWQGCTSLECMGGLDTRHPSAIKDYMFDNTPALQHPTAAEQTDLTDVDGALYSYTCP